MGLVPWWSREAWDVAADALGMSLPALVEHPNAYYWRLAGLAKARGDVARQKAAEQAAAKSK